MLINYLISINRSDLYFYFLKITYDRFILNYENVINKNFHCNTGKILRITAGFPSFGYKMPDKRIYEWSIMSTEKNTCTYKVKSPRLQLSGTSYSGKT